MSCNRLANLKFCKGGLEKTYRYVNLIKELLEFFLVYQNCFKYVNVQSIKTKCQVHFLKKEIKQKVKLWLCNNIHKVV